MVKSYRYLFKNEIRILCDMTGLPSRRIHCHHEDKDRDNNNPDNISLLRDDFHYKDRHPEQWDFVNDCHKSKWDMLAGWNKGIPHSIESRIKMSESSKGQVPWNKGTKGIMKPNKTSFKKGHKRSVESIKKQSISMSGEKHPNFKHDYVNNIIKAKNVFRWANIPFTRKDVCEMINYNHKHLKRELARRSLSWEDL